LDKNKLKVVAFAGSLRQGSYNKALLRAATDLVPDDMQLEISDLEGIPPFNQISNRICQIR
jgi:chromate reductase